MTDLEIIDGDAENEIPSSDNLVGYERTVLSGILGDHEAVRGAADAAERLLAAGDFSDPRHRIVYQAIGAVRVDGGIPDAILVRNWLAAAEKLRAAGGEEYLACLVDEGAPPSHVPHAARRIFTERVRRTALERLNRGADFAAVASWHAEQLARVADGAEPPTYRSLGDYLKDPEILKPPAVIVPRMAWRSRVSMLAAEEKLGKSTVMAAAAAACSTGSDFLGEPVPQGMVVYVSIDESVETTICNLARLKADPARVIVVTDQELGADRIAGAANAVRWNAPDLTLIDSLWKLTAGLVEKSGDAGNWAAPLAAICEMARKFTTGLLLSHHATKATGRYRDSSAIGAAVDMILEMLPDGENSPTRKIEARGRHYLANYVVRLNGNLEDPLAPVWYDLETGELALETRVYLYIQSHPNCSSNHVKKGVRGNNDAKRKAVLDFIERGAIQNLGTKDEWQLVATAGGNV